MVVFSLFDFSYGMRAPALSFSVFALSWNQPVRWLNQEVVVSPSWKCCQSVVTNILWFSQIISTCKLGQPCSQAPLFRNHAVTIGQCPAESRDYRNSPSGFYFFTAIFSWVANKNLQHDHCSSICNALMITGAIETFAICRWHHFHWPWFSL